jgi:CHAT domain-containing protein/tetratricopeptide (TPR) repeat protein
MDVAISATSAATGTSFRKSLGIVIGTLLLFGCTNEARNAPSKVYARADADLRSGDLTKALEEARSGFSSWRRHRESPWYWRFRLLSAEILLLESEVQQALPLLGEEPPPGVADRGRIEARLIADCGYATFVQGRDRYPDAGALFGKAYEKARQSDADDLIPRILIYRASLNIVTDHAESAENDLRLALAAAEHAHDRYWQANSIASIGTLRLRLHRYDEAIEWSRRALQISQAENYRATAAKVMGNLGWCYYRLGDLDSAETYLAQAEPLLAMLGRRDDQQTALGNLGSVHFSRQDYKNALVYYKRALATAQKYRFDSSEALWLNNIATTYIEMGDLPSAEPYNRRALELQSRLNDKVVSTLPMLNAAGIALGKADYGAARQFYDAALQAAAEDPDVQWETHYGLAELYSRKGDPVHAREEFEEAAGILDTSWSDLLNDDSKLTFPSRSTQFYRSYVDFLMGQDRGEEALSFIESRRARLLAEKMGAQPAAGSLQDVARRSNAVLLSYWLAPEQSYLWVTAPGGFRAFKLGPEAPVCDLVERYSKTILDRRDGGSLGSQLYNILVAPAQEMLPRGVRVVVVPDGCLHGLNLETLIAPSGRYWIEEATVVIAPSLRLLRQDRRSTARSHSILLIGDPIQNDPALPELQFAGKEIAGIASLYGDAVVKTRERARPEAYRAANPSSFRAIHFAAHAVPNRDSPLDSAVVLSQGKDSAKLYAREVQEIPLSADLVTVSACRSAGARTYPGEGLVGFAWAFLSAGAHHVVASLWDVSDQSTAAFMQALYTRVRRGAEPAAALREVKLEFLRSESARRKPYYWAPFQLYVR